MSPFFDAEKTHRVQRGVCHLWLSRPFFVDALIRKLRWKNLQDDDDFLFWSQRWPFLYRKIWISWMLKYLGLPCRNILCIWQHHHNSMYKNVGSSWDTVAQCISCHSHSTTERFWRHRIVEDILPTHSLKLMGITEVWPVLWHSLPLTRVGAGLCDDAGD